MTADMIQEVSKELENFAKQNFGLKFGSDYPEFAKTLASTEAFKNRAAMATMMGMLAAISLKPAGVDEGDKTAAAEKWLAESPMREVVAELMYLGYRLGKADAEVAKLTEMAARS